VAKKTKPPSIDPLSLIPKASATDLRGRQSIRVAFKLTPNCIEAMNILGAHLRLKPKSLFDHMVQERKTLKAIAAQARPSLKDDRDRVTKTYVISRDAALALDEVARDLHLSRDLLVETSVRHLMPLIQKEQVRHSARKILLGKMERHLKDGRNINDEMRKELGRNDPMYDKMTHVMEVYERAFTATAEFIKKGENIEGFETEG
jgi:hypothetical protein